MRWCMEYRVIFVSDAPTLNGLKRRAAASWVHPVATNTRPATRCTANTNIGRSKNMRQTFNKNHCHSPEASAKKTECSVFKRSHLRTARHKERGQSCGNATAAAITHESEAYRSFDTEISNDTSKPGTWMDLVKSAHLNEQLFIAGRKWRWKSYISYKVLH